MAGRLRIAQRSEDGFGIVPRIEDRVDVDFTRDACANPRLKLWGLHEIEEAKESLVVVEPGRLVASPHASVGLELLSQFVGPVSGNVEYLHGRDGKSTRG